jgi:SAM-dependent methyltransferase
MPFDELKQKQSVMWGNGPYQRVTDTIGDVHAGVIEQLAPRAGDAFLDLACGTGAVSTLAARAGADVTGVDLAPVLIDTAKERAAEDGLTIDYLVGDCENLTFADASFDKASSTCGIMFAPDHAATASELARVVRPGGRMALANWTLEGGLGRMFGMMAPFQPKPPEGVGSPFAWGNEAHVDSLLGGAFDLEFERHISVLRLRDGEEYWQIFSTSYGPTKSLAESLDDERREELHRAWVDFFDTEYSAEGGIAHDREYLLVLGTRR